MIYGYVSISTIQQSLKRQTDNIQTYNSDTVIYEERLPGGREVLTELLSAVCPGDTIIFDSISRMADNEEKGYSLYIALMNQGISLVFLKEPHIGTDEIKRRVQSQIAGIQQGQGETASVMNPVISALASTLTDAITKYAQDSLKDDIKLAFMRAEKEHHDMVQRVISGKAKSGKRQGRPKGSPNKENEKTDYIRQIIKEHSKDFGGTLSDAQIMQNYLSDVARGTYYKYKKELKERLLFLPLN